MSEARLRTFAGARLGQPRRHAADQFLRPRRPLLPGRPAGLRFRAGLEVAEGELGLSARPPDAEARLRADRFTARREGLRPRDRAVDKLQRVAGDPGDNFTCILVWRKDRIEDVLYLA